MSVRPSLGILRLDRVGAPYRGLVFTGVITPTKRGLGVRPRGIDFTGFRGYVDRDVADFALDVGETYRCRILKAVQYVQTPAPALRFGQCGFYFALPFRKCAEGESNDSTLVSPQGWKRLEQFARGEFHNELADAVVDGTLMRDLAYLRTLPEKR